MNVCTEGHSRGVSPHTSDSSSIFFSIILLPCSSPLLSVLICWAIPGFFVPVRARPTFQAVQKLQGDLALWSVKVERNEPAFYAHSKFAVPLHRQATVLITPLLTKSALWKNLNRLAALSRLIAINNWPKSANSIRLYSIFRSPHLIWVLTCYFSTPRHVLMMRIALRFTVCFCYVLALCTPAFTKSASHEILGPFLNATLGSHVMSRGGNL